MLGFAVGCYPLYTDISYLGHFKNYWTELNWIETLGRDGPVFAPIVIHALTASSAIPKAILLSIFSERKLAFTFAICCRPCVCRLLNSASSSGRFNVTLVPATSRKHIGKIGCVVL